ncbi:MAG: SDR family oxidoreductase [Myxococcota bacterium]
MAETKTAFVQGASRGIGLEFVRQLLERDRDARVIASCRSPGEATELLSLAERSADRLLVTRLDVQDEASIADAAEHTEKEARRLTLLVNAAGVLHGPGFTPEKKLGHVDPSSLRQVFEVNAFGPLLVAKHFAKLFRHDESAVYASLSARVGSISDNRLGGWYAYRGSKAAQNMFTKTLALEMQRIAPRTAVIGLHPGTVDTDLSKPFQRNVPKGKLFEVAYSVSQLLAVIDGVTPSDSGRVFDFAGSEVPP